MTAPLSVEAALARMLAQGRRLPAEAVPLAAAAGRVLAGDVVSDLDLPPFDHSAMDGYAVRAADLAGASPDSPVSLPLQGAIAAAPGEPPPLAAGHVLRLMTGAPWPPGADAVVPVEVTREAAGQVWFTSSPRVGAHRRAAGSDLRRGEVVVADRTTLGPPELALLAAAGQATVAVSRRPRVLVVTTGDELVDVAEPLGPGQVRDSSGVAVPARLVGLGAVVVGVSRVGDDATAFAALLQNRPAVDLVVTCGGVSMGERDFVRPVFERLGRLDFWQVAVKPGKPLLFGRLGEALFCGLPGNPVSSLVSLDVFVRPLLDRLLGRRDGVRPRVTARLETGVRSDPERTEYVRVVARATPSGWAARSTGDQSSGRLTSLVGANGYAIVPDGVGEVAAGGEVTVELFGDVVGGEV